MIRTLDDWRSAWSDLGLPAEAVPAADAFGTRYPWRAIVAHAHSPGHRRRVEIARQRVREALAVVRDGQPLIWRLGWSAGKDSTAIACLLAELGVGAAAPAFGEKDDIDYPAETEYLDAVARRLSLPAPEVVRPRIALLGWLRDNRVSLVEDLHSKAADLSREHFYQLLDDHRARSGHTAVLLGLRSAESKHRAVNRASHGWMYTRRDGLTVAAPLADWTDEDVHAYVAGRGIPLLPVYLCVDPGQDAMKLRKSWWIAGGGVARYGHYVWLRRWWPDLWRVAVGIDPEVAQIS